MNKKKIVILGAGFGGMYSYLGLKKYISHLDDVEITVVDLKNYFLFAPMLHEVATGNLEPTSVIQPVRQAIDCSHAGFIEGEIKSINVDQKRVAVIASGNQLQIDYDYLIMAMGSTTHFFNTPGADKCIVLKSLNDAILLRNKVVESFEQASVTIDETTRKELLNFVVIGGGPTGVELAGELADLLNHEMKKAYPGLTKYCDIHLIQAADRLMPPVHEWFHNKSKNILEDMGVKLNFKTRVTEIKEDEVVLGDGGSIKTSNVFWTAGVKAREVDFQGEKVDQIQYEDRSRRIQVLPTLQIPSQKDIFVIGDQMCLINDATGQPYPMRAQFAARAGTVAGINIASLLRNETDLKKFSWKDQGFIISLGKGGALAEVFGMRLSGPFAWWMYRTAYLFKLVGARAKLKTAYEWTINLFLPRDISKL